MEEKGAEAPPIDTEGTLRNIDWLEADQTRKAEVRVRSESPREDGSCLIPVYSVDTVWENRNHKNLIRLIRSVSVERKRLIFNTDVEVVWIGTTRSNT
ncbi:hypothetical protein T03_15897 [Trichinella britovi]|uniref:Uncharacterized protein n=1 Tax=Trichinella britovi TaxID=45882 RepID=A0A0V1CEH1_TRIBR|nr:hypothetical protein T03_15897 [Trichinella britovi]